VELVNIHGLIRDKGNDVKNSFLRGMKLLVYSIIFIDQH